MFRCIWYDLYILPVWKYEFYVLKVRKRKLLENVNKGFLLKLVIRKNFKSKVERKNIYSLLRLFIQSNILDWRYCTRIKLSFFLIEYLFCGVQAGWFAFK